MKNVIIKLISPFLLSVLLICCKGKVSDADIEAAINSKKSSLTEMAAVNAEVKDGVVTLSGTCTDDACKTLSESTVQAIPGVKSVVNNITVQAPVVEQPAVPATDPGLAQAVADAVKDYPGVKTELRDSVLVLTGEIKRDDLQKLMMSLSSLKSMGLAKIESSALVKK